MKNKKVFGLLAILVLFTLVFSGCAHSPNVQSCIPVDDHVYGFWAGVWHGFIAFISFIGGLFDDKISIYAINNNGAWYNFGYVGGLGIIIKVIRYILKLILN